MLLAVYIYTKINQKQIFVNYLLFITVYILFLVGQLLQLYRALKSLRMTAIVVLLLSTYYTIAKLSYLQIIMTQ